MKLAGLLVAALLSACVIETDGTEDPVESGGSETYSNHVKLECNGSVLIDRTFTSRTDCEDYRANNSFTCGGVKLTFSC